MQASVSYIVTRKELEENLYEARPMITDSERESLIDAAFDQMSAVSDPLMQAKHFADMCYHIRLRSPEQIYKMESERRIGEKFAPVFTYTFDGTGTSK